MVSEDSSAPAGRSKPSSSSSFCALAHHGAMLQQAEAHVLVAEEEIGGDGQMRAQHHFLVDRIDAEVDRFVRGRQRDRLAFPVDLAAAARDRRR